jgi:hypothetical protein
MITASCLRRGLRTFLLLPAILVVMLAVACGEGEEKAGADDALVFEQASYSVAGSVSFDALPDEEVENVGEAEDSDGRKVYRQKAGEKGWQLLTRDEDGWTVWQPAALTASIADLAARLDVPPEDVGVQEVTRVTWPDTCLGVPRAGEACAQVLTEGFRIVLGAEGKAHEYHSDLDTTIRSLG